MRTLHELSSRPPCRACPWLPTALLCGTLGCQPAFLGKWVEVGPDERPWDKPRKQWSVLELDADGTGTYTVSAKSTDCSSPKKTYSLQVEMDQDAVGLGSAVFQTLWPHRADAELTVWAKDREAAAASGFFDVSVLRQPPKTKGYRQRLTCSVATDDLLCFHGSGLSEATDSGTAYYGDDDYPEDAYDYSYDDEAVVDAYACRAFFRPGRVDAYHLEFYFEEGPIGEICPPDPRDATILQSCSEE